LKYDLIINGIVIPDQDKIYRNDEGDLNAARILADIVLMEADPHRRHGDNPKSCRHVGTSGTRAVLINWDRVVTMEVRMQEGHRALDTAAYLPLPAGLDLTPAQIRDLQRNVRQLVADLAQMEPDPDRKVIVLPPGAFIPGEIYAHVAAPDEDSPPE
jgi:hypothetical protein